MIRHLVFSFALLALLAGALVAEEAVVPQWTKVDYFGKAMICDHPEVFKEREGMIHIKGRGVLWTEDLVYDLSRHRKYVVDVEVRLHKYAGLPPFSAASELCIMFAGEKDMTRWSGRDDYNVRVGCDMEEEGFYTLFRRSLDNEMIDSMVFALLPNRWQNVRLYITKKAVVMYSGNDRIFRADTTDWDFPRKGRVGLLGYRDRLSEIESFRIYPIE